jgi:NitT/TauT family transport system substrate-binding protein
VMGIMQKNDATSTEARTQMAKDSGTDLDGFDGQVKTTRLYPDPAEAAQFVRSKDNIAINDLVRKFCFAHGMMGEGAKSVDVIGIAFPNGTVLGDPKNIKFRYDPQFMEMAAQHKL